MFSASYRLDVSERSLHDLHEALHRVHALLLAQVAETTESLLYRQESLAILHAEAADRADDERQANEAADENHRISTEAEEHLRVLDRAMENVEDARRRASPAERAMAELLDQRLPAAVRAVGERLERLRRITVHAGPGVAQGPSSSSVVTRQNTLPRAAPGALSSGDPSGSALPPGFAWVPLTDISSSDDLRPEERYHKTPLLEVFEGFLMLRDAVLPALKRDPSLTMDGLREHGEAVDRMGSSPKRVYAAFFGHDCIRLGRSAAGDQYTVEDGRHRIHVARALGWRAVPARARTAR